jgi:hypothetical protein
VTCYTQPCKPCKVTYILHYLPQGDESSLRGSWGICAPALPEVLTIACCFVRTGTVVSVFHSPTDHHVNDSFFSCKIVITFSIMQCNTVAVTISFAV